MSISINYLLRKIQAVTEEPGFRLPASIRLKMEHKLRADLSDLVVHLSPLSDAVNSELDTQAFTVGNHICFRQCAYDLNSDSGLILLAHELAHVVQKRLGKGLMQRNRIPSESQLEIEATAAAVLLLQDEQGPPLTPDPTNVPRFWGAEGITTRSICWL